MPTKLITPPTAMPVTRDQLVKVHIKVDGTDEDALIDAYIAAATDQVQNFIQRQLMQATYELQLNHWMNNHHFNRNIAFVNPNLFMFNGRHHYIILPKAPLVGVVSIKYDDVNDAQQTLDPENYQVDNTSEPGKIVFTGNLPNLADNVNAVRIRYVAGYGLITDNTDSQQLAVPALSKVGILREVANMYENRQDETVGTSVGSLMKSTEYILNPLRLFL